MKVILSAVLLLFIGLSNVKAQLTPQELSYFKAYEDTINTYSDSLFNSESEKTRKLASYDIIRTLKTALKKDNSYLYAFSNLKAISIVEPEDKTFKIFTWQLILNNNTYKYFGAIQMNSPKLKLFPLLDQSDMLDQTEFPVIISNNEVWIGALYYDIKKVKKGKNVYYTLFGYDGNNVLSTKKIVDVLWFKDGEVRLGAPIFDTGEEELDCRFIIEYRKGVSASLKYSEEEQKIIVDHLIPENEGGEGQYYTYVPDGSYDGFEWKKGVWVFISKLFNFELQDGEFPMGN